ncbi:hypothetical protein FA15DRAFT_707760 [Coprinopsis marcescibilis]|uniref:Uncharacterized protein n=1 Tax=Coprinopsis marcescibilis TaxID=230819 RepID=A0A5C3KKD1_COPMA|nr:hypothetical protein FA15DRAFT_707760 [Coprinopsis marcescibilis]
MSAPEAPPTPTGNPKSSSTSATVAIDILQGHIFHLTAETIKKEFLVKTGEGADLGGTLYYDDTNDLTGQQVINISSDTKGNLVIAFVKKGRQTARFVCKCPFNCSSSIKADHTLYSQLRTPALFPLIPRGIPEIGSTSKRRKRAIKPSATVLAVAPPQVQCASQVMRVRTIV